MDELSPLAIEGLALELLTELGRFPAANRATTPPRWLRQVQDLLHARFRDNLSLEERNVRCWSTEADGTQLQEESRQFAQSAELGWCLACSRRTRIRAVHALWCSPRRKFSIRYSEVRSVNAKMLIVVVLSVQFRNTLASHT